MKKSLLGLGLTLLPAFLAQADFDPIPLTPGSFTADVVVEKTAAQPLGHFVGLTMDNEGTNVSGAVWYEVGYNTNSDALTTGVPAAGSTFTTSDAAHQFKMAPSYTAANNALFIARHNVNPYQLYTNGALTLTTPAALTAVSVLHAAGNGPLTLNYTIYHADDSAETGSFQSPDWFASGSPAYLANGRVSVSGGGLQNVNGSTVKLWTTDIPLSNATSPVTKVEFSWGSGGGRSCIFAVAGSTDGTFYTPLTVTGYNADMVVEASAPPCIVYQSATTATMDGGTNNTANTWYEQGYYTNVWFKNTGLPPAGSVLSSVNQPDHHYQMPASYTANNAMYVDTNNQVANITFATPATYSALSFLSATANGTVTNQCIIQHSDGTQETNTFLSRDWFNNTPFAFSPGGRVHLTGPGVNNTSVTNLANGNPRLYEAQFALVNTASPVTNILLKWLGAGNIDGRVVVFAVSGTAGAVPPIIAGITPLNGGVYEGSNFTFTANITGGTQPITYQWQKGTNGVWVNLVNGGNISGATTTNLVVTAGLNDLADYRVVASNVGGSVNSGIATLSRVVSTLPDISSPADQIQIYAGSTPFANETVIHAIDNNTDKYLTVDADDASPFDPVGFIIKPAAGNSIVTALRIYTSNDAEGRDPTSYVLEGSQDGGSWTTISSGALALTTARNASGAAIDPLTQNLQEVRFANSTGYSYYRVTFNTTRDPNSTLMQIGEIEFLGALNPNSLPNFVVNAGNVTANEGTTATFTALATGAQPITYQWYDVTGGETGTAIGGATSSNLVLNSVTVADNGRLFRVVATNPQGSVTNPAPSFSAVQLTVNSGPITFIQDLPSEMLFYAGRTATISALVGGTSPSYQWQSNGVNLVDSGRFSGTHSNVLMIANAQISDSAVYQLLSSNNQSGTVPSTASTVYVVGIPTFHTNGVGWYLNGGATIDSEALVLTSGSGQARSAFFNVPLNIENFTASFTYQDVGGGGADGFVFALQNVGTNMLGGGGGGLGFSGTSPNAGLEFSIYNGAGIAFQTNGVTGTYDTNVLNFASGDPIDITIRYANPTLSLTLSNTASAETFTTNFTVGDLKAAVGGPTAYVGFTGASGGIASTQWLYNYRYVPHPVMTMSSSGNAAALSWPASIGGYSVESNTNLTSATWSDASASVIQTNAQNRAVISPAGESRFYRLALPLP